MKSQKTLPWDMISEQGEVRWKQQDWGERSLGLERKRSGLESLLGEVMREHWKPCPSPSPTPPQFLCGEHWTSPQRRARSRLTDHPSHWLSQQQLWPVSQSYMDESSHCPSSKTDISVAQTWPRNCTVWRNPIFPGIGQKGKPSEPIQTGTAWGQNTKIAPTQPPKVWLVSII